MYSTSIPVTEASFFDREDEIRKLQAIMEGLQADSPTWLAIIGPQKIGKTSLLLELARRAADSAVVFVVIDCFEELPLLSENVRRYALRLVDGALGTDLGTSLEALASRPAEYRAALQRSSRFDALEPPLRSLILELAERRVDAELLRQILDLPERLARSLEIRFLVAWDEIQELATLSSREITADFLPLMRSRWQRHRRASYVISGSARTMLSELVTDERSPFFQHFTMMELGTFLRDDAIRLLRDNAPGDRPISEELAGRVFDVIGGHPFYLQLLGEALTRQTLDDEEAALKQALQELLFSSTGRLALYFENELRRLAGRSGFLAKTLEVLAAGPTRLSDVARAIGSATGSTARYLERLQDAVVRGADGRYRLADPVFGLWLAWRQPGGTVVPMRLVGDDAEQAVARHLAEMGFDLIYQSRASRGAFDLLATRGPRQLNVQVKRSALPLRFTAAAWKRMEAEARRFGWRWVVAAVTPPPDNRVVLLDPASAKVRKNVTVDAAASIDNLLLWVDRKKSGEPSA